MRNSDGGWNQMFPTKSSFVIFNLYIILFVNQALLVKGSQSEGNSYSYSTVTVVLLTELAKLIISAALYLYTQPQRPFKTLWAEISGNLRLLALYIVPAALYCLYNNLAFHNLSVFDPTTYYLLLQFRVVVTALVYQVVFRRQLSWRQWVALLILTAGCVLKQLDVTGAAGKTSENSYSSASVGALLLVLVQTVCSCVAGVYNEHLLKGRGCGVHILVQNVFMYLDSILCNLLVLAFYPGADGAPASYADLLSAIAHSPIVLVIICNSAAVGIVTSFFLMALDSILKVFASGLDLALTAVMCLVLFGIPVGLVTVASIALVLLAVWLYSTNPLPKQQFGGDRTAQDVEEGKAMLLAEPSASGKQ